MDAITLGLQGQQARINSYHKYQALSDATVAMLADDMDVNRTWIVLMNVLTTGYHYIITTADYSHPTVNSGWDMYRMSTALRELAIGEAPNTSEEYTRGYADACHDYGTPEAPIAVARPENAYDRGWNQALRDLVPKYVAQSMCYSCGAYPVVNGKCVHCAYRH